MNCRCQRVPVEAQLAKPLVFWEEFRPPRLRPFQALYMVKGEPARVEDRYAGARSGLPPRYLHGATGKPRREPPLCIECGEAAPNRQIGLCGACDRLAVALDLNEAPTPPPNEIWRHGVRVG